MEHTIYDQAWITVEEFLIDLPPALARRAMVLKNSLTVQYSETGYLRDILSRDGNYSWVLLPIWLVQDWSAITQTGNICLEKHLFSASFYTFAAVYLQEQILDESSFFDIADVPLVDALQQQAAFHFKQILAEDNSFWSYHQLLWTDFLSAVADIQQHQQKPVDFSSELLQQYANQLSSAKIAVIAAAIAIDRAEQIPSLLQVMDYLNYIHQIHRDILAIRRDIMRGCYTYPIVRVMQAANIPLSAKPSPENLLGAMVLTGVIANICRECCVKLKSAKILIQQLILPSWSQYCDHLEISLNELVNLFSLKNSSSSSANSSNYFLPYIDNLNTAITTSAQYLLSDLTFRESWEIQRLTLCQKPEVLARAFPMGLVLEILCSHGHNLSSQVDDIFQLLEKHHFCYFENHAMPPDTDNLGLLLRLYQYSSRSEIHRSTLQPPLSWLKQSILPSGEIPVWLTQEVNQEQNYLVWGSSCLAVEINILLGLIAYDWANYEELIERSVLNLFERFIESGFSGLFHYEPLYCLWNCFQLLAQLEAKAISKTLQIQIQRIILILLQRLQREIVRYSPSPSPQEAAFFILACLSHPSARFLLQPKWSQILYKHQRYDGSWADEPLYPTVHRSRQVVWYSSRTVTSAFCYHALQKYQHI